MMIKVMVEFPMCTKATYIPHHLYPPENPFPYLSIFRPKNLLFRVLHACVGGATLPWRAELTPPGVGTPPRGPCAVCNSLGLTPPFQHLPSTCVLRDRHVPGRSRVRPNPSNITVDNVFYNWGILWFVIRMTRHDEAKKALVEAFEVL